MKPFKFDLSKAEGKLHPSLKGKTKAGGFANRLDDLEDDDGRHDDLLGGEADDVHRIEPEVNVPVGKGRHFTTRVRSTKSGPGTLEPLPIDGFGRGFANPMKPRTGSQTNFANHERPRQEENVYQTLMARASNLPPDIEKDRIRELFQPFASLNVVNIEMLSSSDAKSVAGPSASMKVVFGRDATTRDLDDALNKLNDKKYLGCGHYLHLDRYLGNRMKQYSRDVLDFGARWEEPEVPKGYAPPPDLGGGSRDGLRQDSERQLVVRVEYPDLETIVRVHSMIEGVINGGVEFEAAMMNDPEIQQDETWAWLYDSTHPVARYYRWKLYRVATGTKETDIEIFKGYGMWKGPTEPLPDEWAYDLATLHHESGTATSSEDEDEDEGKPQYRPIAREDDYPGRVDKSYGILPPKDRAYLHYSLRSLPRAHIKNEDIANFSLFAMDHATKGLDQVVDLLVTNIIQPIQLTETNPDLDSGYSADTETHGGHAADSETHGGDSESKEETRRSDVRQVTLNALHILSDVLLCAKDEGGKAYKYIQVAGAELKDRTVFKYLDNLPSKLEMGRMTEKSFRDDVNSVLGAWQREGLFDTPTQELLENAFNAREKQREEEELAKRQMEKRIALKQAATVVRTTLPEKRADHDEHGKEGIAETKDQSLESKDQGAATGTLDAKKTTKVEEIPGESAAARARRLRPKAEDMFAS